MSYNLDNKLILIGAGEMACEYSKVLNTLNYNFIVVGRGKQSASNFKRITGKDVEVGGIKEFTKKYKITNCKAIVAVGWEELSETTTILLNNGVKDILLEKPGGLDMKQINHLSIFANEKKGNVFIAYNRRFFTSVIKAKEIIDEDGGVSSFYFNFTERSDILESLNISNNIKSNWLLANSSHVIDLAFYLGGLPQKMSSVSTGSLVWHPKASKFCGFGKTVNGVIFSYIADWGAPGRWSIEINTRKNRIILCPLEEISIQKIGSFKLKNIQLSNKVDIIYKPGLFKQTDKFLKREYDNFLTIEEQAEMKWVYDQLLG